MKIIIVGGGTAGWLAALFVGNHHPEIDVTVVASKEIGVLGAGEAVTGAFTDVITGHYGDLGIDPLEFLRETSAMPKYGIMHENWTSRAGFNYFGPIDGSLTVNHIPDSMTAYLGANYPDTAHVGSFFGSLYEHNISPVNKIKNNYDISTFAFHFDAKLAGKYLEKIAIRLKNVTSIDAKVLDANLNEQGEISSITLDDTRILEGDFFIDATGFRRLLVNKLKTKWISYQKYLPVDSALPFFINYKEDEVPKPYSVARAQSSGWYWEAGIQSRKGCGYVYSSEFITVDQAKEEIEKSLGHEVIPINHFKFDTGRLENTWVKNCLAIGLCGAFAEPLEATSIHSTIQQLAHFSIEYLRPTREDTINPGSIKIYNRFINTMFDDYKEFLISHYLGGRTDSEFWKYITAGNTLTEFTRALRDTCRSRMPTKHDFPSYPGAAGWSIWCHILIGTGQLSPTVVGKYLNNSTMQDVSKSFDKLSDIVVRLKQTHYTQEEYWKLLKHKQFLFNPRQGIEYQLQL